MTTANGNETTGWGLKTAATVTMLIDHLGAALMEPYMMKNGFTGILQPLDAICRLIGRAAFPIYIFCLVEGFEKTRSRAKYLARLIIVGILTEPCFDIGIGLTRAEVLSGKLVQFRYQNIFVTLAVGMIAMILMDGLRSLLPERTEKKIGPAEVLVFIGQVLIAAALCWCNEFVLKGDYGWNGVAAICAAYLIRKSRLFFTGSAGEKNRAVLWAAIVPLAFNSLAEFAGLMMLPLVGSYNGKRGRKGNRWFFYAFYPVHLLVLGIIRLSMDWPPIV